MIRPLAWLAGPDGRLSFGKVVVCAILALSYPDAPSDALGAALLLYAFGRLRKGHGRGTASCTESVQANPASVPDSEGASSGGHGTP